MRNDLGSLLRIIVWESGTFGVILIALFFWSLSMTTSILCLELEIHMLVIQAIPDVPHSTPCSRCIII